MKNEIKADDSKLSSHPKKKTHIQKIVTLSLLFVSILIGLLVTYFSLKDDLSSLTLEDLFIASSAWKTGWYFMVAALGVLVLMILFGGLRYYLLFKVRKQKITFIDSLIFGILSKYYVLITPFGLGGQPIVIGLATKKNVPLETSIFVVLIELFFMRFSMFFVGLFALIYFAPYFETWVLIFGIAGWIIFTLTPSIFIFLSGTTFYEKMVVKLLSRLNFIKNKDRLIKKFQTLYYKYRMVFQDLKKIPGTAVIIFLLALTSQVALMALPFFILKSYPDAYLLPSSYDLTFFNVMSLNTLAAFISSFVPTAGNSGMSEFTFAKIFSSFFDGSYLLWAIFSWRTLTFYVYLVLGVLITMYQGLNRKKMAKRHRIPNFNKKPRVVIFTESFYPFVDGVVKTVEAYALHLQTEGFETIVVTPRNKKFNFPKVPYKIYTVPAFYLPKVNYPIGGFWPFSSKLKKLLETDAPVIYHTHAPFLLAKQALRHAQDNHIPVVTTFHSKYYDDFYEQYKNKALANWGIRYILRFYKKVHEVWTVSSSTGKTLESYGYKKKYTVVPNGIDFPYPKNLAKVKQEARKFIKAKKNEFTILFVGNLLWQKNLRLIAETLLRLDEKKIPYHMVLVGEGRFAKSVIDYFQKISFIGRVTFTGEINDQSLLAGIYAISHIFFFPSVYDNNPLVIKEAATMSLPALLIKDSNSAENIIDRQNGFLADENATSLADTIEELYMHPELLKEVGAKAFQTLPFSWAEIIKDVALKYEIILKDYYR